MGMRFKSNFRLCIEVTLPILSVSLYITINNHTSEKSNSKIKPQDVQNTIHQSFCILIACIFEKNERNIILAYSKIQPT